MNHKYLVLFSLILSSLIAFGSETESEKKINYLFDEIKKSNAVFLRNGSEHKAKQAISHLKFKLNKAKNMFWFFGPKTDVSVEDFIEKIASHSSSSGKKYYIKLEGKEPIPIKEWYYERLKHYKEK